MSASLQSLLILIFFVDLAIMLGVGGRLLWVANRTRRAPEAAIGTSAAFGALGVILSLVATHVLGHDPDAFPIWAIGRLFAAVGVSGLAIGSWRIYRPDDTWAAAVAAAVCLLAGVSCAIRVLTGSIGPPLDASVGPLLSFLASLAAYGWATVEAFRYYSQLKRRMALGLADAIVTEQFRLWAVSGACVFASTCTSLFFLFVLGLTLSKTLVPFVAVQVALFAAALCLWFAFFPPAFYRRRLSRLAAA